MNTRPTRPVRVALALVALLGASSLPAADENELIRCAQIRDDAERLECFDQAARRKTTEIETGRGATTPQAQAPQAQTPPPPPPAPAAATAAPEAAAASKEESFGAEQTRQAPKEPEVSAIRSTIVGHFDGFAGGTEVRLANGQLWVQTDAARLAVNKADPEVVIEKGFFGGYRLSVVGLNRSIRVRRVE